VRKRRWFLPETPDLVGQLRDQAAITSEALEAFAGWAGGDEAAGDALPEIAHRGDASKRALLDELRDAFVTPIAPEDLFALSRGIDWILVYARDLVSEARAMGLAPDARLGEMAGLLRDAVSEICKGIAAIQSDGEAASAAADRAIQREGDLERSYYRGMAELLRVGDRDERIASRELYRGCVRVGEEVIDVAERIIYAVVKES